MCPQQAIKQRRLSCRTLALAAQGACARFEDADYSDETTEMAKAQILSQASTAMIAQANLSQQNVLSLLR
jgi:flagellin-like hook-associated protein FlgL